MQNSEDKTTIIEIPIADASPAPEAGAATESAPPEPEAAVEAAASENVTSEQLLSDPLQECESRFKRLAADFANYKRRSEAERTELLDLLEARLLNGILAIYDDFRRLSQHTANVNEQLAQGLNAVQVKWQAWLTNENVEVINPVAQKFDPHFHDALMQQEVAHAEQDGQVVYVIESGYKRRDKVLRHAKVIVGHYEAAEQIPEAQVEQETEFSDDEKIVETE